MILFIMTIQGYKVPTSTNALVELMNMVERWRQRTDYGPVVVVSQDGISRYYIYYFPVVEVSKDGISRYYINIIFLLLLSASMESPGIICTIFLLFFMPRWNLEVCIIYFLSGHLAFCPGNTFNIILYTGLFFLYIFLLIVSLKNTFFGKPVIMYESRCGVYCAANACIEQVIQHGEVDVFQAAKTVRRHRPQLVENLVGIYIKFTK